MTDAVSDGRWHVRTLAIVFVDCADAWSDVPDRGARQAALVASTHEHGAVHVEALGDGVMAAFDGMQPAIALVDEVAASQPRHWRIGLHAGDVSVSDDGRVFGMAVHLAARLYQHCPPGQVLASTSARLLAADPSRFGAPSTITAKGFPDPIGVVTFAAG